MGRRYVETNDLVGSAEIAERVGVTTAAVSNWQNRHTDFPEPLVKLVCGPVFEWKDVEQWLERTGRKAK